MSVYIHEDVYSGFDCGSILERLQVKHSNDASWKSKLWTPNYIFMNTMQAAMGPQKLPLQFEFTNDSRVIMSSRSIMKLSCTMDLFYFPQDTQECYVDISADIYKNKKVRFVWMQFNVLNEKEFSKFEFPWITETTCDSNRGPNYDCIRGQIHLFRRLSYYIIRIYAPSFLLVITAFVGFWIPVCGYPARVAVTVTPMLTLATQQNQINAEINVHYVVALHIWMIFCTFFVFMSLIEYAVAIIYCHHIDEKKERMNSNSPTIITRNTSTKTTHFIKKSLIKIYGAIDWSKAPLDRNKVDYCARIIFPLLYILFVLIYVFIFIVPWAINKY
ncbi:glutamate-gated chloride channel-like protein [Leptotrombidium deliense]|uniref:Glutamate-gated chloride channel-like protein n=1 Tax=Leptotrombidium deliense TaxID=299467 RepID=A0A443SFU8_9ACAR|nr:glutamate-gated chloride channel-like protein [Leptotrombidium deliense]